MDLWQEMHGDLDDRYAAGLLRVEDVIDSPPGPRLRSGGREFVAFCSNDYLSLAAHPTLRAAAVRAIERWGVGSGASRLISGTTGEHVTLEQSLAELKQTEAAIVFSTGWMANHAAIHALAGSGDLVLNDKLNHASILDASKSCGARMRTYPHNDLGRLETLLDRHRAAHRRCLIVTDSLFSMDGDLAPLTELAALKRRFDAQLLIDEAHATGVLGDRGSGAAEMMGVEDGVDATVGTLSKALGALGGFVAGRRVLIETIRNTSRPYIYTTAPPPAICAAAEAAVELVRLEPERRRRVLSLAETLRGLLREAGLDVGDSASQIIPVLLGDAERAVRVGKHLMASGFAVGAIRPPTVPRGTSRLRISLCSGHEESDLTALTAALREALLARA